MAQKWNYSPEQSHKVKNLKVSNNILKKDIEKLELSKVDADEATILAIDTKIAYKQNRIEEKAALVLQIQEEAGKVDITYAPKVATVEADASAE